jgi:hypothetical protein
VCFAIAGLVIVGDFWFVGVSALPDKTNSALVIDPNAELPVSIPSQFFQAISWRLP